MIAQVEDGKGGADGQGKSYTSLREELLGLPRMGRKCRQAVEADRQGRRPGGRLIHTRERWGGEAGAKRLRSSVYEWKI